MRGQGSGDLLFDPEIEKIAKRNRKKTRETRKQQQQQQVSISISQEVISEEMGDQSPPRRTLGDFGRSTNIQILPVAYIR